MMGYRKVHLLNKTVPDTYQEPESFLMPMGRITRLLH